VNTQLKNSDKKKTGLNEIFVLYFVIFSLWAVYRIFFSLPEWVDEFITKPILWLTPLYFIQKKWLSQTIKSLKLNRSYNIIFGLFVGILYFCAYTLFSYFKFGIPAFNPDQYSFLEVGIQIGIALSTGFVEEFVFRRFILEKSLTIFNDSILANSFTTFLFTFIHLPIIIFVYKYSLIATLSYLSIIAISSFIYGLVYLKNKSLIASTMTHTVWNFLGTIIR